MSVGGTCISCNALAGCDLVPSGRDPIDCTSGHLQQCAETEASGGREENGAYGAKAEADARMVQRQPAQQQAGEDEDDVDGDAHERRRVGEVAVDLIQDRAAW